MRVFHISVKITLFIEIERGKGTEENSGEIQTRRLTSHNLKICFAVTSPVGAVKQFQYKFPLFTFIYFLYSANKVSSYSQFKFFSLHVSHEVVSHTNEIILMTLGREGLKPGLISHNLMVSGQSQVT